MSLKHKSFFVPHGKQSAKPAENFKNTIPPFPKDEAGREEWVSQLLFAYGNFTALGLHLYLPQAALEGCCSTQASSAGGSRGSWWLSLGALNQGHSLTLGAASAQQLVDGRLW